MRKKKIEKLLQLPWMEPVNHEGSNEILDLMRAIGDPETVAKMERVLSGKQKDRKADTENFLDEFDGH